MVLNMVKSSILQEVLRMSETNLNTLERINHLIDETQPAVEGLSQLNYEGLNSSISSLTDSVEKLSGFMNNLSKFSGFSLFH